MLVGLEYLQRRLSSGSHPWSGGRSTFLNASPGEGAFLFDRLTVGVVLAPLPSHHAAYGDDRRRSLPLNPGQGWIFPAGLEGWCRWDEPNDFLNVEIDTDILIDARVVESFSPLSGTIDPLIVQLAVNIHAAGREDASRLYRDTLGAALAAQLGQVTAVTPFVHSGFDQRIARATDYLEAHLAEDISLDDLAAAATMSRFHFARVFRRSTGLPPYAYLVARRMERARELLRSSKLPIAEIAWRVGYANPAKFAAQFRRLTGTTPGAWRTN